MEQYNGILDQAIYEGLENNTYLKEIYEIFYTIMDQGYLPNQMVNPDRTCNRI